ncbi:MAG: pyridoxamine 5'-phosphate oxidase family protein [Pseudomonadota bacterium]
MGKEYSEIDDRLKRWLARQKMFFVATAPLAADGLVNCSPKGGDTILVTGPRQLAYLDYGGSGIETVAHLKENQRIVIMFCAFEGPPKIYRFHGAGRVLEPGQDSFDALRAQFPDHPACRNIIVVDVDRISDSCGYGVPMYEYTGERTAMATWIESKTEDEMQAYRAKNNRVSLDGLPGLGPGD